MPPKKNNDNDEREDVEVHISFRDLEQSMTPFTGDDTYPISEFFDEFEDVADLMKWTKVEKLIYAKKLLGGTAKLFLRSIGRVKDYPTLKEALIEEFGPKFNSAKIHKNLISRKIKNGETLQQYFLVMKEIALHGRVDDAALMEYVIDGINDPESNKAILYGATDLKDFRKKLDIYSDFRKKLDVYSDIRKKMSTLSYHQAVPQVNADAGTSPSRKPHFKRCYNCGDLDHQSPGCTKGIKCFKCNEFGHKGNECKSDAKKSLIIQKKNEEEKIPYKKVLLNGTEMVAFIDTGSDANLIIQSEFEKIENNVQHYDKNSEVRLTGIANKEVLIKGVFTTQLQIDDAVTDIKFYIVEDDIIPVKLIIGNPILREFEVKFTRNGIVMEKIPLCAIVVEKDEVKEDYKKLEKEDYKKLEKEDCKKLVKVPYQNHLTQNKILYKEKNGSSFIAVPKKMDKEIRRQNYRRGRLKVED